MYIYEQFSVNTKNIIGHAVNLNTIDLQVTYVL